MEASSRLISAFKAGNISTEALMFQSGYLTIAEEEDLEDAEERCQAAGRPHVQLPNPGEKANNSCREAKFPKIPTARAEMKEGRFYVQKI
jgi:hypothetical protein